MRTYDIHINFRPSVTENNAIRTIAAANDIKVSDVIRYLLHTNYTLDQLLNETNSLEEE